MPDTPATDTPAEDAVEAAAVGERPDLGRTRDALAEALSGTDSGSDTRAGSLEGGSASGSDDDPDQDLINETLASEGMANKSLSGEEGASTADPADDRRGEADTPAG